MIENTDNIDLIGFPEGYGTKNCYDCGKKPPLSDNPDGGHWEKFVIISGKDYSVPVCDECIKIDHGNNVKEKT